VDIICFDFGRRLEFPLKLPAVKSAMKRGIHFEISIGVALRDSAARKHLISNSLDLMRITTGKNIIITSNAMKAIELRGPYDLANLYPIRTLMHVLLLVSFSFFFYFSCPLESSLTSIHFQEEIFLE